MFWLVQLLIIVRVFYLLKARHKQYILSNRALGFDFETVNIYVDTSAPHTKCSDIQLTLNSCFALSYSRLSTIYVQNSEHTAAAIKACSPEADQLQIALRLQSNFVWGQSQNIYCLYVKAGALLDNDLLLRLWSMGRPKMCVQFTPRPCPDVERTWVWLQYAYSKMVSSPHPVVVLQPPNAHAQHVVADVPINTMDYTYQTTKVSGPAMFNSMNGLCVCLFAFTGVLRAHVVLAVCDVWKQETGWKVLCMCWLCWYVRQRCWFVTGAHTNIKDFLY